MDPTTLLIPFGFVLLAGAVCWSFVREGWFWRLIAVLLLPAYGLLVWLAMPSYQGWPTSDATPERALLLWAEVRRPDPQLEDKGAIIVLLEPLAPPAPKDEELFNLNPLLFRAPVATPRLFSLPFSEELEKRTREAITAMEKSGAPVTLRRDEERARRESEAARRKRSGNKGSGAPQGDADHVEGSGDEEPFFYGLPETETVPKR